MSSTFRLTATYRKGWLTYKTGNPNLDDTWRLLLVFERFSKDGESEAHDFNFKVDPDNQRLEELSNEHIELLLLSGYMKEYFKMKKNYNHPISLENLLEIILSQILVGGYIYHSSNNDSKECGGYEKEWLIYESPSFSK